MKRFIVSLLSVVLLSLSVAAQALDAAAEARIDGILRQMTLAEKIELLGGTNFFQVKGAPRVGLPLMTTADSPFGVRSGSRAVLYAGGINLAATFNEALAVEIGTQIGRDARARGVHFNLGPGVNIYRSPLNGRNFEYFGEDPLLAGRLAVGYIKGVQSQGVAATIKHFLANNSEFNRHGSDSVIDERTLREIYLPAFEMAVKEGKTAAIMNSYNLVNGLHATENPYFNKTILRDEWGFSGLLMSDWDSTYDTLGAANGGLDLEMPFGKFLNRKALQPLLDSGKVTEATIDEKVRRMLRLAVRFGWMDRPQRDPSIPLYNAAGRVATLEAARQGMVLLKNDGNLLPFDRAKTRHVAVIGPAALNTPKLGFGSSAIVPFDSVGFAAGITRALGKSGGVSVADGIQTLAKAVAATKFTVDNDGRTPGLKAERFDNTSLSGQPTATTIVKSLNQGAPLDLGAMSLGELEFSGSAFGAKPFSMRWSGFYNVTKAGLHDVFVQQTGFDRTGFRLFIDGKLVADRFNQSIANLENFALELAPGKHQFVVEYQAKPGFMDPFIRAGIVARNEWVDPATVELAKTADAVVVAVGFDALSEGEGFDRTFELPPGQNELIRAVTAVNKNVVVVITSGGGVDMEPWIADTRGVLQAWYAGQEGGTALGEILFGDVNPSGHLPATFERRAANNPAFANYYERPGTNKIEYKEGIFVGYRGYERNGTKPLFPFGHGLSYTRFTYSNASVKSLGEDRYEVSFDVTNSGGRDGAAVPQLYLGERKPTVPRPVRELKGFARVELRAGEKRRVTMPLDFRSFAFYDVASKSWKANRGAFDVYIGSSVAATELKTEIVR